MALILKDRVQETSTTTGTGTLTLAGAVTEFQSFSSAIGNGNTTYYTIYESGGTDWEVGLGTVGAGTLSRDTVYASSNAGALVNFLAGTKYVFCDYPASKAVYADASNKLRVDGNPYVDFEDANGTTVAAGRMWYSNTTGAWNLGMGGGNITQQVGEELFVYGKASTAISDSPLQIVYKTGVVGASGVITFAPTVAGITNDDVIVGVATENIALNATGRVTCFGVVHNITTNGAAYGETWADGDVIWYNPVTGNPTKVKPTAPNVKCQIGTVINAGSGSSGSFQVEIIHGTSLGGTDSNVNITSVTNGQILTYDGTNTYWKNTTLTAGTGITTTPSATGVITVTNTAPDQTVVLNNGTGISVTGTYPNFTITNTSPSSGGTVTSVTATAPVASTGGTTPVISMPAANGSTNGYLTSTDWTTFNNKGSGTVTSVAATAGTGISVSGSPITSSGTLNITNTAPMTYPGAGIPNSTGSAWGTSYTTSGSGTVVALATGASLNTPVVTNYTETLYAPAAGTAFTISLANGTVQEITLNGNGTITLPSSVAGKSFVLIVTYTGAYTLTWAGGSTIKWPGGTAPTASSANGKYDIFTFFQDGTNTYGNSFGLNY